MESYLYWVRVAGVGVGVAIKQTGCVPLAGLHVVLFDAGRQQLVGRRERTRPLLPLGSVTTTVAPPSGHSQ